MARSKTFTVHVSGLREALAILQQLGDRAPYAAKVLLKDFVDTRVIAPAKELVPVDFGTLKSTLQASEPIITGTKISVQASAGGPAAPYALCVGARMGIAVEGKGIKQMNSIRVGDRVLTQAGVWKPVRNVFRYQVQDGTPILHIHAQWRQGKDHVLEVTENHEIMVFRDGKNQWIKARDLVLGDQLYRRKKIVHNTGVTTKVSAICLWCTKAFAMYSSKSTTKHRRFCCIECYWDWRSRPGNNHLSGRKRPSEVTAKMSASMTIRHQREPEKHPLRVLARKGHKSSHVEELERWLDVMGITYKREVRIGNRFVDFFCPDIHRIIEADGSRWHRDQAKDILRDQYLISQLGKGWEIVHIHYFEARYSPTNLQGNPLPNVYYVAVNPGPATYTEPSIFAASTVLRIDREIYQFTGGRRKYVYDLEVADIQSYTVSGLLVHNSVHENPRSGKTGGVSPSGRKYKSWAQVGEWKFIERPALAAASNSGAWLAEQAKVLLERLRK